MHAIHLSTVPAEHAREWLRVHHGIKTRRREMAARNERMDVELLAQVSVAPYSR